MSKLKDCATSLNELMRKLNGVTAQAATSRELIARFASEEDLTTQGVGLELKLQDFSIPVPLPEREQLQPMLEEALSFLHHEIVRLWEEIHKVACDAHEHCCEVKARAESGAT